MSYTGRSGITGSNTATTATSSFTLTFSAAPIAGNWITIALIPNDIVNCYTTSITINGIALTQLDSGYASTAQYIPEVWGAPYQAGMAGQTVVTINWANGSGLSRTMYAIGLIWAGASATPTTNYANFRTSTSGGLIDGAGNTNPIGSTVSSNGAVSDANGVVSFSRAIPTSYDSQYEPALVAAVYRGGTPVTPASATVSGGSATIVNGVITSSGAPSGTLYINSSVFFNGTVSGTIGLVGASGGNIPFSYTGSSPNTLTNCTVPSTSDFYTSTTIPSTSLVIATQASGSSILVSNSSSLANSSRGGFATTGAPFAITIAGGTLGAGRLVFSGLTSTGLTTTNAYVLFRASVGGTSTGGAVLLSFVPSTRQMSRISKAVASLTSPITKRQLWSRLVRATVSMTSSLTRFRALVRQAKLSQSEFISVSKISRFNRISRVSNVDTSSILRRRNITRATLVSLSLQSVTSRFNRFNRLASSTLSSRGSSTRSQRFNRRATATQSVTATVIRNRKYGRVVVATSSYTIGTTRTRTLIRRAIASSNTAVKVSKAYGRYYLVKSSSTIKMATSRAVKLIISSTALWNSTKNTTTRIAISAQTLVNKKIFASSNDWQQPNNGQPITGTGTEIFDNVPETINETDDGLGTDVVPFHE